MPTDYILGRTEEKDVHIALIDREFDFIKNKQIYNNFAELKGSVKGLTARYVANLSTCLDSYSIDVLFMVNSIQEEFLQIYFSGLALFCDAYDEDDDMDKALIDMRQKNYSKMLLEFNEAVGKLRQKVDKYIMVLSTSDFYNSEFPYFKKEIEEYGMSKFEKEMYQEDNEEKNE